MRISGVQIILLRLTRSRETPLLTTNVPVLPFDYVDFDVKLSEKPQKLYRVRQP